MRFFVSDTHFGHQNIIKYCNRPFNDVSHMNEALIENWNSVVGPDDEVFHLGDVALGPWEQWDSILTRLNGQITLVIGNHDRIFAGNKEKHQQKFIPHYNRWFDDYYDNLRGIWLADGTVVDLSHFPYESDHTDESRYMDYRLADSGRILIHGHVHTTDIVTRSKRGTLQVHVGADAHNYRPVSEDEVIEFINKFRG